MLALNNPQCAWYKWETDNGGRRFVRCQNGGTINAGSGLLLWDWKVCERHVSWWHPSFMPTWWFWGSVVLVGVLVFGGALGVLI